MTDRNRPAWYAPALAGILYFSQGFPFGIVDQLLPLYMRLEKVSLAEIGFLSAFSSAWTWKFIWSPLVDRFGTYRRWMSGALIVLTITIASFAFVSPHSTALFFAIVAVLAFASATQDIAIDAMTVRITPTHQLGYVNSVRVAAYRGSMIIAGGALAALTAVIGWRGAFLTAAAITAIILIFTFFLPPETGERTPHARAFAGLPRGVHRWSAWIFLAMALIYKLGDVALVPMVKPFWVDKGYGAAEIGTVTTVIGISVLIIGAFIGGAVISRYGIYKALIWLGILAVFSNAGYGLAAQSAATRPIFYTVVIVENFCSGLGTAAFLAFLMSVCDKRYAATQYAILTAAFAGTRFLIGSVSGILAERMGYAGYFWLTLILGIPGLLLVPLVRNEPLLAPSKGEIVADV